MSAAAPEPEAPTLAPPAPPEEAAALTRASPRAHLGGRHTLAAAHATSGTYRAEVLRSLQRRHGNATVQRAIAEQHRNAAAATTTASEHEAEGAATRAAAQGARVAPHLTPSDDGSPLEFTLSGPVEAATGRDTSQLRLHAGPASADAAEEIGARAFASGDDVYFGRNEFRPHEREGLGLIAHEAAHAAQYSERRVAHAVQLQVGPLWAPPHTVHDPPIASPEAPEKPAEAVSRIVAESDAAAIERLTEDPGATLLSATTPLQRAGMIRILLGLTWTTHRQEAAIVWLLRWRSEQTLVMAQLDAAGFRERLIDQIREPGLKADLGLILENVDAKSPPPDHHDPAIAKALKSRKAADVMAIADLSRATDDERLGLLRVLLDLWHSNAAEERKMLDILESSGSGLGPLMKRIAALGLKQSLFDHIDDAANKARLTELLQTLHDPQLDDDLRVFNQGFLAGVVEGISGGWEHAKRGLARMTIGDLVSGMFRPILHPVESIEQLLDDFVRLTQEPSADRLIILVRDWFGLIGAWIGVLAMIAGAIALAAFLGVITIPASFPIAAIATALGLLALGCFLIYLALSLLKLIIDTARAGAATTRAEMRREQREIGGEMQTLIVGIAMLAVAYILKFFFGAKLRAVMERLKRTATTPSEGTPPALDEQARASKADADAAQQQAAAASQQANQAAQQGQQQPPPPATGAPATAQAAPIPPAVSPTAAPTTAAPPSPTSAAAPVAPAAPGVTAAPATPATPAEPIMPTVRAEPPTMAIPPREPPAPIPAGQPPAPVPRLQPPAPALPPTPPESAAPPSPPSPAAIAPETQPPPPAEGGPAPALHAEPAAPEVGEPEVAAPTEPGAEPEAETKAPDPTTDPSPQPADPADAPKGSEAHKQARWQKKLAALKKAGKYPKTPEELERYRATWEKKYNANMGKPERAAARVRAYRDRLGWGLVEGEDKYRSLPVDDEFRRLDIIDEARTRGVEHKTGRCDLSEFVENQIAKDKILRSRGWDIRWHFEGTATNRLLTALQEAGIPYTSDNPAIPPYPPSAGAW